MSRWAQSISFCVWPWFFLDVCLIHFSNLVKGWQTQLNVKSSSLLKLGGLYINWSMTAINYTATMEERDVQGESTSNTVISWFHTLTILTHLLSWDCYIFQKVCVSGNVRTLMKATESFSEMFVNLNILTQLNFEATKASTHIS